MGKRIWPKINFFIWLPEIRYKSYLTILLRYDEARSGAFTALNCAVTIMSVVGALQGQFFIIAKVVITPLVLFLLFGIAFCSLDRMNALLD